MHLESSSKLSNLCQKIWNLTREQLSVRYPFFRKLLWDFSFQESFETDTVGTDGQYIYFNPEFLIKYFEQEPQSLENVFLHMLYHCLFLHLIIESHSDQKLWDQSCDIAVARLLTGSFASYTPKDIYQHLLETREKDNAAYRCLLAEVSGPFDDHRFWHRADKKALLDQIRTFWKSGTYGSGFGLYGCGGRGSSPGTLSDEIILRQKHKKDFHRFLKRFAVHKEELQSDTESFDYIPYMYGLEHYGNMPLIEHLEYQEVNRMEELVIAIDTSGSCTADIVRRFMEETYGILSDHRNFFDKMNLYILQCDCFIQDAAHITCEEDWQKYLQDLKIHGRGGTDFRPVFSYTEELRTAKELRNLKGLLYFTDGDGIYPEKATDYQTAFVFYHKNTRHQKVPKWITCLYLDDETLV